jgi:DNA polymerase-3 subunit gamma/tau
MLPNLSADTSIPEFEREKASAIAKQLDDMQLLSLWKVTLKAYADVKQAPFADQALEVGLMRVCFAAGLPSIEQLLAASGGANVAAPSFAAPSPAPSSSPFPSTRPAQPVPTPSAPAPSTYATKPLEEVSAPQEVGFEELQKSSKEIASVNDLFAALEEHREALLLSYIRKDIAFVSFAPGNIAIQVKQEGATKIIPLLKKFLNMYTGIHWNVNISNASLQAKTTEELEKEQKAKDEAEILKTPIMSDITKMFPGSDIKFE